MKIVDGIVRIWQSVRLLGAIPEMDEYEKGKLSVFNQVNFFGLLSGLVITLAGLMDTEELPLLASLIAFSPALISGMVLFLNSRLQHERAKLVYFSFYPVLTSLVYGIGLNVGIELFFILYGLLGVFYIRKPWLGLATFLLSGTLYFLVFILKKDYAYELRTASFLFYAFNHLLPLCFIYISLAWIKRENTGYQERLLHNNEALLKINIEISNQRKEIEQKAEQLAALNAVKNKLFSVISHDLKNPIYAMRNLFRNIEQYDLPGDEIKVMLPDMLNDLNYTTALMENLLQWAKAQMEAAALQIETVDLGALVSEVTHLIRLQAQTKNVYLDAKVDAPVYVHADRNILNLVLRNLVSNAVKFTPEEGDVVIEAVDLENAVEISVRDTGVGMSSEVMSRLSNNEFFSSRGTANEGGTGLGLMLCREYLQKMGSRMYIESTEGSGSTFSFVLPKEQVMQ